MRDIVAKILLEPGPDQAPLPSIRQLANHYKASTLTIHKALRQIQQQGIIYCIPSKGFFWGTQLHSDPLPRVITRSRVEQAKARFFSDFQCGVYHPSDSLPALKALSQIYHLSPTRISQLFQQFVQTGILNRKGRNYYLASTPLEQAHATVLLVSRCNTNGQLLFDSERETDFIKAFQRERMRLNLRLEVAGWLEEKSGNGKFVDQYGKELKLKSISGFLIGAIVSTWLMRSPLVVLKQLWKLKVPVSLWWEQSNLLFPRTDPSRPSTVGFNISFGQSAGMVVGRYLSQKGYPHIAFISPFHASEWSKKRLAGLQSGLINQSSSIHCYTDHKYDSAGTLHKIAGIKKGEQVIRRILQSLLDHTDLLQQSVWVTVNDHTALLLIEILKEKQKQRPYIISFDNSTIAESYRIDSFEFHTEGMVRQMFYHLQHPHAILYQDQGLHEMVGRLVIRN